MTTSPFQLKVQQIEQVCLFELTWGQQQRLTATLPYPAVLSRLYQEWQRIYLSFYNTASLPIVSAQSDSAMMGQVVTEGSLTTAVTDWHGKLVQAEAALLYEFHRWLRNAELFEIRAQIAQLSRTQAQTSIDLFLTCTPIELTRLPWETWEISTEFAAIGAVRIVRIPAHIRTETNQQSPRQRPRILAVLGDNTGLNFQAERKAVQSLDRFAEVIFVGWQPGQLAHQVREAIQRAIEDSQGWDILFFAGHSNETQLTGGEIGIAPGVSLAIQEIMPALLKAKQRGLQFAIFNSCSGISIAESLIDLGFSQVAIMREPIHNRVAQEFLVQFLQNLAEHKDVHQALLAAGQFLKLEKNLTYPSAYLIPSLFLHPDATPYRLPTRPSIWQKLRPTKREAIALPILLLLSLFPFLQQQFLLQRSAVQAVYRDVTRQIPTNPAPVLLVQIDEQSLRQVPLSSINPIDRSYLAQILSQVAQQNAKVIGVDYAFDRLAPQPQRDEALSKVVTEAMRQPEPPWFVFGAFLENGVEVGVNPETNIAQPNWSLQGYTNASALYLRVLTAGASCQKTCPFPYLLSIAHQIEQSADANVPQPQLSSSEDLRKQVLSYIRDSPDPTIRQLWRSRLPAIYSISRWFEQRWLQPILDYSIPIDAVYDHVSAARLLDGPRPYLLDLDRQVVIVAAGGYEEAGLTLGADNFPIPPAIAYWRNQSPATFPKLFTGAEILAYSTHHLLQQHFVVPVPDLWMVGVAIVVGKSITIWRSQRSRRQSIKYLVVGSTIYAIVGLQAYVTMNLLLPWLLPVATLWVYIFPTRRNHA